ncbi:MAG: hypothetical protein ABF258_00885, partial [Flavobacteriales bacterium]
YKILPNSILDDIQDKLMKKIDFSLECLTIDASGLDQKIFYLYNPFFFKCLNFLDPIVTDSKLPSLVNLIIKKSDSNRTLYRVLFCMGMYYPVSESMRKVLKQNQSFAMSKGVAQQMDYKKHPKGETVSSSDNLQNGELKSYLTVFIVIVVLMTLAITFALSLSNRNTTNEEKVEENTVETFINQALKNQSDKHNALMPIQVAFNEDTIGFLNLNSNTEANKNIKITNNSDKHIALVMGVSKGYSILCLKPNQTRSTSFQFNYYTIYQGGFPTKYAIFTEKGDLKRAFLFREFDYTDKNMLQDRKLSPISFSSTFNYTLEINSGILELKSKESRPLETQ